MDRPTHLPSATGRPPVTLRSLTARPPVTLRPLTLSLQSTPRIHPAPTRGIFPPASMVTFIHSTQVPTGHPQRSPTQGVYISPSPWYNLFNRFSTMGDSGWVSSARQERVSDRWLPGRHGLSTSETLTARLWKASDRGHKYLVGYVEWVLAHERARPASRDSEHGFSQGASQRDAHGPDE